MFIIFGSPRSGTTVLASTLSLHPYLKVIDQTDFIVPAAFVLDRIDDAEKGRRLLLDFICSSRLFPRSIGPYLNRSDIQDILFQAPYELAGLLIPLYDAIAGRCRKKCCGDKSVADIAYLPILNRGGLFQGRIKFIHIVRDVRAVCASLEKLNWVQNRNVYPRSWANANLSLHEMLRNKDYYYFLRYEDMVSDPKKEFTNLCKFLGFDYDRQMEDYASRGLEYVKDGYHTNLQKPFFTKSIDQWKIKLSRELLQCCESQAAEALRTFGYTHT